MNQRTRIALLAGSTLLGASGCSFLTGMLGAGGASDASAFTVDMERYDVKSIDLRPADVREAICPGARVNFKIVATATDKKKSADTVLETAAPESKAADARGKMDLGEFAMAARGGTIENGVFASNGDPFQVLLGFDVKATYRLDKTKEATRHFAPVYSCFTGAGGSGSSGSSGSHGQSGSSDGGAGGGGGDGGGGEPGPRLQAFASIVETPIYDKVGILRVSGDREQLTLFDLEAGITVAARGGSGGSGGSGGAGGRGADGSGTGGPGGPGGQGGPGADGGTVIVTLDDRYPELASLIRVDVSGGGPGSGGNGGGGGNGGPPPSTCSGCKPIPAGANGPGGPGGPDGTVGGRPGSSEVRSDDVASVFAELPKGVRLRSDSRPAPVEAAPPPPPTTPSKGKRKKPLPV